MARNKCNWFHQKYLTYLESTKLLHFCLHLSKCHQMTMDLKGHYWKKEGKIDVLFKIFEEQFKQTITLMSFHKISNGAHAIVLVHLVQRVTVEVYILRFCKYYRNVLYSEGTEILSKFRICPIFEDLATMLFKWDYRQILLTSTQIQLVFLRQLIENMTSHIFSVSFKYYIEISPFSPEARLKPWSHRLDFAL